MDYLQRAMQLKEETVENRRYLHQHPELGFDLPMTCRFVWDALVSMGYDPVACGKSGITVTVGHPRETRAILLRAVMDGVPMREESGLPFASTNGNAHTCGHDMHTAMLLGAARLLMENEDALPGVVKLMFQPAEEILAGARDMIEAGVLDNPQVDAAIGAYILSQAPTGFIGYNTGVVNPSSDAIRITIRGQGGHGAQPSQTVDPINVAAHLHLALQELTSREVDSDETAVLTFGSIQAGSAHNTIPEMAVMKGTLRTFEAETREFMLERLRQVAENIAGSFRATAELEVFASTRSLIVNPDTAGIVADSLREMLGDQVMKMERRAQSSEDFAEISERVPSMFYVIGSGSRQEGHQYPLYNPRVTFNEDCLPIGAACFAQGATEWLKRQ